MTRARLEAFPVTGRLLFKLRAWSGRLFGALALITPAALPRLALAQDPGAYSVPPPPYDAPPAPPPAFERMEVQAPEAPPVDGQWVYTRQYGWVWMPYDQVYTRVSNDQEPSMYIYAPTLGWRWVVAPWVFNGGPEPYWGARGRAYFAWHSRPWFERREYRPALVREPRTIVRDRRPVLIRDDRTVVIHEHRPELMRERRPAYVQEARATYRRDYRPEFREHAEHWGGNREQPSFGRDYRREERPNQRSDYRRDGRPSLGGESRRTEAPAAHGGNRRESFGRGRSGREVHEHEHGHSHGRR
jgi:hypothetical protein